MSTLGNMTFPFCHYLDIFSELFLHFLNQLKVKLRWMRNCLRVRTANKPDSPGFLIALVSFFLEPPLPGDVATESSSAGMVFALSFPPSPVGPAGGFVMVEVCWYKPYGEFT